jgi:hypothetical protein
MAAVPAPTVNEKKIVSVVLFVTRTVSSDLVKPTKATLWDAADMVIFWGAQAAGVNVLLAIPMLHRPNVYKCASRLRRNLRWLNGKRPSR